MTNFKDLIENPHFVYKQYKNYWNFLLDSWEGGPDYCKCSIPQGGVFNTLKNWALRIIVNGKPWTSTTNSNLFSHPKERPQDFQERLNMAYYYNFCAPIIDIYTEHLFKQPIIENFGSIEADVETQSENIDHKGGSIGEFRKEVADMAQVYGHVYVITDSPQYNGQVISKADILENGLLPYFTIHHPQNIINWALDEFGAPYWVIVAESSDYNQDPFNFKKDKLTTLNYRLWTRQEWVLYNDDYKEIGRGVHGLGVVPITCIYDKQSKKQRNFLGISSIADIAFIARDVFNSCSELKQILRDQTFAFLAIQGNSSEYDELSVGTSKGLLYPPDRNAPQYISPPSQNAEVYFTHIDRQVSKMFQLAKLESGGLSAQVSNPSAPGTQNQSGVSKAWDFNQTNSALSKKAGNLEDGETKLWQNFARWQDKEFDGAIEYPHDFNVNSLVDDLNEAEKIIRLDMGAELNKEVKSVIITKKFPRMPKKEVDRLIDDMKTKEDTNTQNAQSTSGRLLSRIPSLMSANNANSSGSTGGLQWPKK
jgi:hypothetical protein